MKVRNLSLEERQATRKGIVEILKLAIAFMEKEFHDGTLTEVQEKSIRELFNAGPTNAPIGLVSNICEKLEEQVNGKGSMPPPLVEFLKEAEKRGIKVHVVHASDIPDVLDSVVNPRTSPEEFDA
jgi:hypothetical protein